MKIFSFTGWSGSGKTTLISKLINELSARGWKVMAVKKASEKYNLEPEGKDSRRFFDSGAEVVFLVGKHQLLKMRSIDDQDDFFKIAGPEFRKYDFILIEGLTKKGIPVFEVFDPKVSEDLKSRSRDLSAVFSDREMFKNIKFIRRNDISKITDFLEGFKQK